MFRRIVFLFMFWVACTLQAQIINGVPYVLSIQEVKDWTPSGPTSDPALIAEEPLAQRIVNTETQFNPDLSNDMQIAYLPDGMNNFANYGEEQAVFNLYNFTHWSYIDKLVWFGGTASQTVQLPSAPWVNAAHKNGVKVLGNVFFAPNDFGGSTATLNNFLEKNDADEFVVLPIMIQMMELYNFDGWFVNEETNTNAATAMLMREFMEELTTAVEALGKEVMWYDAMLLSGAVQWQNTLTSNNSVFVQDNADGNSNNGFEARVSSNIFINFFWAGNASSSISRNRASVIGRSEFDVFTGVDVWPGRNQAPFQTGGNAWMGWLHENLLTPRTSFGLFAPNCVYNNSIYSNFNNDPNDFESFYSEERHMFAGADRNPRLQDVTGFRGYANWVPAASTITQVPFETNFNTGHGFGKWEDGVQISTDTWHNMADQDILPNWQFAFSQDNMLQGTWNFNDAYNGGNSLRIEGSLQANDPIDLILYKTQLPLTVDSKIDIIYNPSDSGNAQMMVLIDFVDPSVPEAQFFATPSTADVWVGRTFFLDNYAGEEIATIGLKFLSENNIDNYGVTVGQIRVHEEEALSVPENRVSKNGFELYQNENGIVVLDINWDTASNISFKLLGIEGKVFDQNQVDIAQEAAYSFSTDSLSSGVYLVQLSDNKSTITKKFIVR